MTGASCLQYQHINNNRQCQVEYCTNRGNNCNLTFFMLSRDKPEKFEKWTRHIRLKPHAYVLKKIYICSDHFELRFFTSTLKRHLIRDAYPTLQRKKPGEAAPDMKQVIETHFVWNNMPPSKNSRNSSSNSEDMHVIASLYLPSDGSKSNEEVSNLSEIDINQTVLPKQPPNCYKLPVLWDKRFYENREKFLEEVIDHYMKKRYFSENEEENKRLFKEKMDSLKDPATLRNEWIAMKLAERYGPGVTDGLSKQPSFISDMGKKIVSEKSTKTCSTQKQVHLAPPVESENSTLECDLQHYVPSTSTVQSSTSTNLLVNQKSSISSTVSDKHKKVLPEKTNNTCSTQNQVQKMVFSDQSKNTTIDCNPPSCVSSTSTVQMRTLTNLVNQKNSTPSTINDKYKEMAPEKTNKICSIQNQVPLTGGIIVFSDQAKNTPIDINPPSCASSRSTVQMRTLTNLVNQKSSTVSTVNDKCKKMAPEKTTKTCRTQHQVHLTDGIMVFSDQSKNTTVDSNRPSCASSTSTVQMRTLTNLVNKKSSTVSAINDKCEKVVPEKTTKIDNQNQVHLASLDLSENTFIDCDLHSSTPSTSTVQSRTPTKPVSQESTIPSVPSVQPKNVVMIPISTVLSKNLKLANQKGFIYSTPAFKSKNVLVLDNLQNINPSTNTKQSENEVETSQPRKVMKLMSSNNEFSSSNIDHMYTKAIDSNSSTNCNLSEQQKLPQNKSKDDSIPEKDCDSIAADIANELKEIRDIQSRSEVLSKIQKLLEEAKSKACL